MDRWDLARRLRGLVPDRRPLLVAVTGYGTAADRRDAAGINLHLVRPVNPTLLVEVLQRFEQSGGVAPVAEVAAPANLSAALPPPT